jgi:hypothetical protein
MRWAVLYARSRQVPAGVAGALIAVAAIWGLAEWNGGATGTSAAFAIVAGAAILGAGLSGQDPDLDRTAAVRWLPRRAIHAVLIGALTGAVVLAFGEEAAPPEFVARNSAGIAGLVALTAAFFGGHLAWTVPVGWLAVSLFLPRDETTAVLVARWMLQPVGTAAATWTAVALGVGGVAAYALAGNRR